MPRRFRTESFRKLGVADLAAYRDHLLRLDAETRHRRFGGPTTDDFLENHAEHGFTDETVVHGLFVGGRLVGSAELSIDSRWGAEAEAGVGIETEFRACSREDRLTARVLLSARNRGARRVRLRRSVLDPQMRDAIRGRGGEIAIDRDGALVVSLAEGRSASSLAAEGLRDGIVRLGRFFDLLGRFPTLGIGRVA